METAEGEENSDGIQVNEGYTPEEPAYAYINSDNNSVIVHKSFLQYGDTLRCMNEDGSEFFVTVEGINSSDETAVISEEDVVPQTMNNPEGVCVKDENLGTGDLLSEVIHDDMHKNDNSIENNNVTERRSDSKGLSDNFDTSQSTVLVNNPEGMCINYKNLGTSDSLSEVIHDDMHKNDNSIKSNNLTERENDSKDLSDNSDTSQSTVVYTNDSSQDSNPEMVFIPAESIVSAFQILNAEESKRRKLLLTHISQESDVADSAENSRSVTDAAVITKK